MAIKPIPKPPHYDAKVIEDLCVDVYTKRLGGEEVKARMLADKHIGPAKYRRFAQAYAPIVRATLDCLNENHYRSNADT